jgi:integrase
MPGTIEQRSDTTWRVRVYAGRDNGKVRWVSRTVTGTKRTAQKELAKLVTEVESRQVVAGHPMSLGELLDRWLGDIAPHRSAYTMAEYRRLVDRDIAPALGKVRLDKLSGQQLDRYYRALSERGLSDASVRRHHFLLHAALARAVKWSLLASNPSDRATPPPLTRSPVSAPAVGEVQRLIAAAEQDGDAVLAVAIALGAVTGARLGELCALRWSDVSWARRTLRVARSLTVIRGRVSEGPTKTQAARLVALDPALEALLRKRMDDQSAFAETVGMKLAGDAYVLSRSADGSVACLPHGLTNAFTRITRRTGIATHFHVLRHFSATTAIAAGMDVRTVAGRLGHADPSVTLRVYAHALEQRDRELAGLLGNAVLGPMNASAKLYEADRPAPPQLEAPGSSPRRARS